MKIDSLGCLVMEHSSWEGNLGDSCAETARYAHLKMLLGDYEQGVLLMQFMTAEGFVRHPNSIWRENDFSSDQMLPYLLACKRACYYGIVKPIERRTRYRTGNGDLVSPGLFAELKDSQILRTLCLLGQIAIFKLPARYNDEKQGFEESASSVCDYLNYIHTAVYAPKWVRKLGPSKEKLMSAICTYYEAELNVEFTRSMQDMSQPPGLAHQICELYLKVIEEYWT